MQINDLQSVSLTPKHESSQQVHKYPLQREREVVSVEISHQARKMMEQDRLHEILAQTPDVRTERISEVKEKLQNETQYLNSISNEELAKAILESPYSPFS